ncbi:MAG: polyphosphate polymerase domain-containing protein [Bacteroidota bacterium]
MRYERKYRIEDASLGEVRQVIQLHPASFCIAFPDRYINSIYFDNFAFAALQENLAGISKRAKFRLRWYGKSLEKVENPQLEIKIKNNFTNRKETKALPSFLLRPGFDPSAYLQKHAKVKDRLVPVSIVRYFRSYFISQDGQVRATIDRELCYYLYQGKMLLQHSPVHDPAIILEVKYEAEHDDQVDAIFQSIPFRLTKNSKYASSINAHYL